MFYRSLFSTDNAEMRLKIEKLEVDVSFSAVVTSNDPYLEMDDNPTVFDQINHNNGLGYDGTSGKPQ